MVGTIFTLWVKHAFAEANEKKKKDIEERQARFVLEDEYDLAKASDGLEQVEQKKKALDREQFAEINEKK